MKNINIINTIYLNVMKSYIRYYYKIVISNVVIDLLYDKGHGHNIIMYN